MFQVLKGDTNGQDVKALTQSQTLLDMSLFNHSGSDDIGDIPLSMGFIHEQHLSLRQIFRSHTPLGDIYSCKLCNQDVQFAHVFIAHLVKSHKLKLEPKMVSSIIKIIQNVIQSQHIYK